MNARQLIENGEEDPKEFVMRGPGLEKFIVISWDESEGQVFWDWIVAPDKGAAMDEVFKVRGGYSSIVDALSVQDMQLAHDKFMQAGASEMLAAWKELKDESDIEDEE